MELDLSLKLTRSIIDEFSSPDHQFAKDRAGSNFVSSETDEMFILTAHLKGYNGGDIKIEIDEDGTQIAITVEKQILQTVMVGRQVYKKGTEIKGFRKAFKIPDGVILDEINATFNDDISVLTITMPKKVKGMLGGAGIVEVKEQEIARENSGKLKIVDDKQADENSNDACRTESGNEPDQLTLPRDESHDHQKKHPEETKSDPNQLIQNADQQSVRSSGEAPFSQEHETKSDPNQRTQNAEGGTLNKPETEQGPPDQDQQGNGQVDAEHPEENQEGESTKKEEAKAALAENPLFFPVVAGSALLASLAVFAFHFIRSKTQSDKKRN